MEQPLTIKERVLDEKNTTNPALFAFDAVGKCIFSKGGDARIYKSIRGEGMRSTVDQ